MNFRPFLFAAIAGLAFSTATRVCGQASAEGKPVPPPAVVVPPAADPGPPSAGGGKIPVAELSAYVDGLVQAYQTKEGIAGVTVAVVDREKTLLVRGYGISAQSTAAGVDPEHTLFRIGSVSKTFTYLAAMQLVEQGKLKLDDEANRYLPPNLQLPPDRFAPVKVWHLMTHTAGFEDSALGHLFFRAPTPVPTLDEYLAKYRPRRVRPPEEHAVYSNYSVALLGALIAHVSGESFESYIENHLLKPLDLPNTTFREPLPAGDPRRTDDALAKQFSDGFERKAGGYLKRPFEFVSAAAPAGAASSSAADMARYLRMLLNEGTLDNVSILRAGTFGVMAKVNFRNAEAVGGLAHGFFRNRYGRFESLEHGGATLYFHSALVVLPEAGLGVFVSTNTDVGREFAATLPRLIFERFLPEARPVAPPAPPKEFAATAQKFSGMYLSERRAFSTFEKFVLSLQAGSMVAVMPDGCLTIASASGTKRYIQDGPLTFRALEGNDRVQFLTDATGGINGIAGAYGHAVALRALPWTSPLTLLSLIGIIVFLSIATLLGTWRRGARRREDRPPGGRPAAIFLVLAALGWIALAVMLGAALAELSSAGSDVLFTYPSAAVWLVVNTALVTSGLTGLAALSFLMVPGASWSIWRKLRHAGTVLAMLVGVLALWQWKFLFAPLMLGT